MKVIELPNAMRLNDVVNRFSLGANSGGSGGDDGLKAFLENDITSFENSDITKLRAFAFEGNPFLTYVSLPNCSTIGGAAFANCGALSSINMSNLQTIENPIIMGEMQSYTGEIISMYSPGAFQACTSLSTIDIPSVKVIGSSAFNGLNLKNASFENCEIIEGHVFAFCQQLSSVSIPNCSKISGTSTFFMCGLSSFTGDNVEEIGVEAFAQMYSLKEVNFPKCKRFTIAAYTSISPYRDEYTAYNGQAFDGCASLSAISFPVCETIAPATFVQCTALTEVILPKVKTIYSHAFESCTSLHTIVLNECTTFSTAVSPSYEHISGTSACIFEACTNLKSVYLLASTVCGMSINDSQFADKVNMYDSFNYTPITNSTLLGYYGSIYVPESLVSAYKASPIWASLSARITAYTGE